MFTDAKRWDPYNADGKQGFTVRSAREFFYPLRDTILDQLNIRTIEECFVASMMTVLNEKQHVAKYDFLHYVEFLEMICRVTQAGLDPEQYQEPIAHKVQMILEHIW